ncbi:MAG: hypothetical protein IPJ19_13560 [Planctomycetes bacterium]|nr:hypothetical protein [Planctomycetota bacterium]
MEPGHEPAPALRRRLERASDEFLAGFFETELRQKPENLAALVELGHVYTRLGRIDEGLAVDRELVRRMPEDPTVHYNLACSLARSGDADGAFQALGRAREFGYCDAAHLEQDEDLASLRGDPRYAVFLRSLAG